MDVSREHFPYGTYPMVGVAAPSKGSETTSRLKGRLLRRLRQNASYLAPGGSISVVSLLGVLLRNCWVPCDHWPIRSWPLYRARQVMREVKSDSAQRATT